VRKSSPVPTALTVAGSDSGGGAGVQADLKTFAALGVHGVSAITCLTAQNPDEVTGIQPTSPAMLRKQLAAVVKGFRPGAVKTGMLYSRPLIDVVARFLRAHAGLAVVIDPVMIATSGARLLSPSAVSSLTRTLLPLATVLTPNVPEAEVLCGRRIITIKQQRDAARELAERHGCAVVVKGGHLRGGTATDIYFDGREELLLAAPYLRGVKTHGTGCTFSAAIAAHLAHGENRPQAVIKAKDFVTAAIACSRRAGKHTVLWPA